MEIPVFLYLLFLLYLSSSETSEWKHFGKKEEVLPTCHKEMCGK